MYLNEDNLLQISEKFVQSSQITLHDFVNETLASQLRGGCLEQDKKDVLYQQENPSIPPHKSGLGEPWTVIGPPHKLRYCVMDESTEATLATESSYEAETSHITVMRALQQKLFPSEAFRAWLAFVSRLCPRRHFAQARRFRPGLDYTLAAGNNIEARLDVVLDLTPSEGLIKGEGAEGRYGGWEV